MGVYGDILMESSEKWIRRTKGGEIWPNLLKIE